MNAAANPESSPVQHQVYLGLGSNIQPEHHLPQAVALLHQCLQVLRVSSAWDTPSYGFPGPDFLNAALLALTNLSVQDLKQQVIRPIEAALGRVRTADKNTPRTIDIDVLIYDNTPIDPDIWRCAFLAVPLAELTPDLADPTTGETLAEASARLSHTTSITPRPGILLNT